MNNLKSKLVSFGLEFEGEPIIDGSIQRCKYQGSKDRRGFYVAQIVNDRIYASFGTWEDRSNDQKYCQGGSSTDEVNQNIFIDIAKIRREQQEKEWVIAAEKAKDILSKCTYKSSHKYLSSKNISNISVPCINEKIVISIFDPDGNLCSLQYISEDGSKKFLYGGRISSCCHIIPGTSESVYICEGWATGQSIHHVTGGRVLVAFNEGNLEAVCCEARKKFVSSNIVLCADNDHKKEKNIGLWRGKTICEKYPDIRLYYPSGIEGTDFNDMMSEKGVDAVRQILLDEPVVCTADDICGDNKETCIPISLIENRGILSSGVKAIESWSQTNIIQYNYPLIISHIATAIAGKIRYGGVHPSFFFIKIGVTSSGKSESDRYIVEKLSPYFIQVKKTDNGDQVDNEFYGPNDFASGPGFLRSVGKKPRSLYLLDEIKFLFERGGRGFDPNQQGKTQAILELSTASGRVFRKAYSDSGNDIVIDYPVPNLIGNATSDIFKSFQLDDLSSGLVQRFDFFCYDGKVPYRNEIDTNDSAINRFVSSIVELRKIQHHKWLRDEYDIRSDPPAVDIGIDSDANIFRKKYSDRIVDEVNSAESEGEKGILSRSYNTSLKLALVHHAAMYNDIDDLFKPLNTNDILFGQELADVLTRWKIETFINSLSAGEFDSWCQMFLDGAKAAIKCKRNPTGATIINKRPKLKNLTPRQWDEVVKVLKARGEIIIKEERSTCYLPIKKNKKNQ